MTSQNVIDVITIALLAAVILIISAAQAQRGHAETMEQYCKGHWTDPREDYADCVRIRQMEDANEFINRAEDACKPYLKKQADGAYMRCLNEYREPKRGMKY